MLGEKMSGCMLLIFETTEKTPKIRKISVLGGEEVSARHPQMHAENLTQREQRKKKKTQKKQKEEDQALSSEGLQARVYMKDRQTRGSDRGRKQSSTMLCL